MKIVFLFHLKTHPKLIELCLLFFFFFFFWYLIIFSYSDQFTCLNCAEHSRFSGNLDPSQLCCIWPSQLSEPTFTVLLQLFLWKYFLLLHFLFLPQGWGCPRGVMVKAMDCGTIVNEFELQSRDYVHFRANTLGNGMDPLILLAMG